MSRDPRIDAYIKKAPAVAQPLLAEIRAAVHAACPDVEETIKWRLPTFDHKGIMAGMAAFKQYTTLVLWKGELVKARLSAADRKAVGQADRVAHGEPLPNRATLVRILKTAVAINDEGLVQPRAMRKKPALATPAYFTAALKKNSEAKARFEAFPPSHKRDYIEWITDAKQEATRDRRIAQALEWIAAGKSRNWKYEKRA